MRDAILTMAARDCESEENLERADLAGQRLARRRKEELASEVGRENATEKYIDALYYYEMWGSAACWKTAAIATAAVAEKKVRALQLRLSRSRFESAYSG